MKSSTEEILPIIGTSMGGGFYAGRIRINGQLFALIVAPKAEGQRKPGPWIDGHKEVPAALSYNDGMANTNAMAEAGSELAKWARGLRIADCDDWYLPSFDELEVIYRNLKPTTRENDCYARSGINLNAAEPTAPYTPGFPLQTAAELFQEAAPEAFDPNLYWSSTQHVSASGCAWGQYFDDGYQDCSLTGTRDRARAVRRLPI